MLRDRLDPAQTGATTSNGYYPTAVREPIFVQLKALLQGPYDSIPGTMRATLHEAGFYALADPYPGLGYQYSSNGSDNGDGTFFNRQQRCSRSGRS